MLLTTLKHSSQAYMHAEVTIINPVGRLLLCGWPLCLQDSWS